MRNEQTKKAAVDALDQMIRHADKGPSGFWTEDHEGCGNPAIFPEFEEGLKRGRLVQKEHFACPWNTDILYGNADGHITTGCYYTCSIDRAKYLSEHELRDVLIRFKTRLENGAYDRVGRLPPLLTKSERQRIEARILAEQREREHREERKRQARLQKAEALVAKYPDHEALLAAYYGEAERVNEKGGLVFFHPDSRGDVVGAEKMSYDEYLDVQLASLGHDHRSGFAQGIFDCLLSYKGQIEKVNEKHICFKRIFIHGMYPDGEMFDGKEDHVWMDKSGFEEYGVGDCVLFGAEVYRYVKTGNGKWIDYGLRHPTDIQKIEEYALPGDDELIAQAVEQLICETCFLSENCCRVYCVMDPKKRHAPEQEMRPAIKNEADKEAQK